MKIESIIRKFIKKTREQKNIVDIDYKTLQKLLKTVDNIFLVDIRSPQEFSEGKLNLAINIPLYELEEKAKEILPDKNAHIIFYCQTGTRSKKACKIFDKLGYKNLYNLSGGLNNI